MPITTKLLQEVRTTNEPSWVVPWLPNKSKTAATAILIFGKISNSGLVKDICTKFYGKMHHRNPGHHHVTKSLNRKLIRVTSLNECRKQKRRSQWLEPNLIQSTNMSTNITLSTCRNNQIYITWKSKMAALEFRKNVNNSALNKDICTKFYGKMHDGHAQRWTRDQKSKPEVNSRDVIKCMSAS